MVGRLAVIVVPDFVDVAPVGFSLVAPSILSLVPSIALVFEVAHLATNFFDYLKYMDCEQDHLMIWEQKMGSHLSVLFSPFAPMVSLILELGYSKIWERNTNSSVSLLAYFDFLFLWRTALLLWLASLLSPLRLDLAVLRHFLQPFGEQAFPG